MPDNDLAYTTLRVSGVICAVRENAVRIAPHFYNTRDEIDRVVKLLTRSMAQ
jgi:selenocysteine lyase/cysteine desulfurase